VVAGIVVSKVSADPDDDKVFACAVEAGADYIVSGDERHVLPVGTFQGIPVVSPREFLSIFEAMKKSDDQAA
jgi:predicted nucleic acid-binding protein